MIKAITMWTLPDGVEPDAFERWYEDKHVPDVLRAPGLLRYETCRINPERGTQGGFYRMAEFTFESLAAMDAAMASPPWREAVADAGRWIAGPVRYVFDTTVRIPGPRSP